MLCFALCALAESDAPVYDGNLIIEDGLLQPMLVNSKWSDPKANEGEGGVLRFCVYVETDNDTDNDGMADLVKALVQVPRSAVEGVYKAAMIYDPTPYNAGTYEDKRSHNSYTSVYVEEPFNYDDLYRECKKRAPAGQISTLDAALAADPGEWIYSVPISGENGFYRASLYDYYLVRGYAVVEASGIGTYGSEGFELCGTHLERDSHKAVVEWLTGDRVAYTDKTSNIQIKADWCNGKVAMTGRSYDGTLPFEVATTGVKGLETIIPFAGLCVFRQSRRCPRAFPAPPRRPQGCHASPAARCPAAVWKAATRSRSFRAATPVYPSATPVRPPFSSGAAPAAAPARRAPRSGTAAGCCRRRCPPGRAHGG